MNEPILHPSEDELSAFTLGQLSDEKAEEVERHVSECDPCCETMMTLGADDDTFVGMLKEVGTSPRSADDTTIDRPAPSNDEIPEPLQNHSRYQIENLVGRGGMGRVFSARHRMMDRIVALKVIHREWVRRQEAIDRFRREVKTAASLDHPNIVTAHDAEQADDLHFLVMEYVDGIDLSETIKERGPLPVADACEYIRQAADGLQYAHDRGMVHRDIKPHNLMVTSEGTVKILDFGLASLAPQPTPAQPMSEDADGNLTIAGAIMGTPDFISPEQAEDAHKVDGRSDIYSLGMTLYFLLSGRVPFDKGSATDKLKLHAEADPTPLSEFRDDVPDELQEVVARMTAKDPAERFQSPAEVASALAPLVSTNDAPSAADGETAPKGRRSRRVIWSSVFALMVVLGLGGWLLPMILQPNAAAPDEVHGPLSELDSYIVAMMNSPHDLVFLNVGEIGPNRNYLTFKPIDDGLLIQLPAFPNSIFDKRQSGYAEKFREVAAALSLPTEDKSEFRNGAIAGVNIMTRVTGDPSTVVTNVRKLIERTFAVKAGEQCEYQFRNLPAGASGKLGEGPTEVTGDELVQEYVRKERVYFGEVNNIIYLIPHDRRAEKQLQRNADVWIANINDLPKGLAARIRQSEDVKDSSVTASTTPAQQSELKLESKVVTGGTGGLPKVHTWRFSGRSVDDWKVRLWLAENGKADIVQEFDFEELPPDFNSQVRLEVKDPVAADHERKVNAILYVESPTNSRCRTTNEDKAVSFTIEAPFGTGREQADLRQVESDQQELLLAQGYWKGDMNHGTSMESMTEATKDGTAAFLFVTLEWKAGKDSAQSEKSSSPSRPSRDEILAAEKNAKVRGTPQSNPAGFLLWRISERNGDLGTKIKRLLSEAAGVPNEQWQSLASSPTASMDGIKGQRLSMVLLSQPQSDPSADRNDGRKDFAFTRAGILKPRDINRAMEGTRSLGFYSLLQPDYIGTPTFSVHPEPEADGGRIVGTAKFNSGTLYAGAVQFVMTVNSDFDLTVTEFVLPKSQIRIVRGADGLWAQQAFQSLGSALDNKLIGSWTISSAISEGMILPPKPPTAQLGKFDITADDLQIEFRGRVSKNSLQLDTTQIPKWIDITDGQGRTIPGIYELKGETLLICLSKDYTQASAKRPETFTTAKDSRTVLFTLKRKDRGPSMSADNVVRRLTQVHGHLVPKLSAMFSEEAGVPNGQWDRFSRDPSGSSEAIKGEPLSLILWRLNPLEAATTGLTRLEEFQYIGGVPKPADLSKVMAVSKPLGYHSMIQSPFISGLTYNVKAGPVNSAKLVGDFRFASPLYSGKVHFIVDVNEDTDLFVSEFSLPKYDITIVKDATGIWQRVQLLDAADANETGKVP